MCDAPLVRNASFTSCGIIPFSPVISAFTIADVSSALNGRLSMTSWTLSQRPVAMHVIRLSLPIDVVCRIAALQKQKNPMMNVVTVTHIHNRFCLLILLDIMHAQAAETAPEGSTMAFIG